MSTPVWAVVPFKDAPLAKSRFSKYLDNQERGLLAKAMLRDVLAAIEQSLWITGTVVVSRSSYTQNLNYSDLVYLEDRSFTLKAALTQACEFTKNQFSDPTICIVPADIPLVQSRDIDALLEQHQDVTIVPDSQHIGTNALVISPPNSFELVFDGKSFQPHLKNARALGIKPKVVQIPSLAHDVDQFDDLEKVTIRAPHSKTAALVFKNRWLDSPSTQCVESVK